MNFYVKMTYVYWAFITWAFWEKNRVVFKVYSQRSEIRLRLEQIQAFGDFV